MNPLLLGLAAALFFLLRKKTPPTTNGGNGVPFNPENINAYFTQNTDSSFDRDLAKSARRVTPDGTGQNIINGTYRCFAPGSQTRRNAILAVTQQIDRLTTKIANTNDSEDRREARQDRSEKRDERAILVAQHYLICEAFFAELQARQAAQAAASAAAAAAAGRDPNIITAAQQTRN